MTDVATPSPTNEPSPTSRKKLVIILGVIALVVIAVIVGSYLYAASSASTKASDYDDEYAAWKAKEKPVLLAATATLPKGTYLRKDASSRKGLATQQKGCNAISASRKKVAAAAERLPTVEAGGLQAKISPDYRDAGDVSTAREKDVRAYVKDASAALTQIERDCRFNIALNSASTKDDKVLKKSSTYLMRRSKPEPGVTCDFETCISSITEKKNKYADLRTQSTKIYRSTSLTLYQSKDCAATSYGSACEVIAKAYDSSTRQQLDNYAFIRKTKSTIDNTGVDKGNAKSTAIDKRNAPRIKKAVLALDPALKKSKQIQKYPAWTDNFFSTADKLLLTELKAQRTALAKL